MKKTLIHQPMLPLAALAVTAGACDGGQKAERPNIIVILADDLGYSDLSCYGSEIPTPNLDRLANNGLRFTHFYNCGKSCPSRASLLTGLYQHQAGVGHMTFDEGLPAYKGDLSHNAVTIAEVLKSAGYNTGMIGKWHVAETPLRDDQAKWLAHQAVHDRFTHIENYPTHRGFDYFYGTIYGVIDYFDPFSLVYGDQPVNSVPNGFYDTVALGDSAKSYLARASKQDAPFFMYLAFHCPHWPLQALPEDIARFEDTYKDGWEAIRNARYKRMCELGLFQSPKDTTNFLSSRQFSDAWAEDTTQTWDAHAMAVHAAMVYRMDQEVGKVMAELKASGKEDNTLVMFLVDNGCSAEDCQLYAPGENDRPAELRDGTPIIYPTHKEALPGAQNVWASVGARWANVTNAPFRYWKGTAYEGGICTPAIVYWQKGMKAAKGSITAAPCHVMDIMATCLDLSGAKYPTQFNGNEIQPLEGISFLPVLKGKQRPKEHDIIGFEHFRAKGLYAKDGWKIVQKPNRSAAWELYNLNTDRTEMRDVAADHPEKLKEMVAKYDEWAKRVHVLPYPH